MIYIEAIFMGSFATVFMDIFAGILATKKVIHPFVSSGSMGRWFLYIFKGKLFHKDIDHSPKLKNEKMWCMISHYLIGMMLAGVFLILEQHVQFVNDNVWTSLVFGIGTVCFPWFWLLPSIGKGVMASRCDNRIQIIKTNLINHTNYGIGLFLWSAFIHQFFF
ncbi:MAG: DUF2938 family protein [Candidatus Electrothrix sp. YB6]